MTYPGSGGQWQPNDPYQGGQQPPGYPQQGGYPQQQGYPQQPGEQYYAPPSGPQPSQQYGPPTGPQPTQQYGPPTGPQPTQQYGPPTGPQPTAQYGYGQQPPGYGYPAPQPSRKRKGLIIGVVAAVIAIAAGAGVTVWALNRSSVQAGAGTPKDAALTLVNAIGKGDVVGLLAGLAPSESSVLTDLNKDMTDQLKRLKVYKQDADPASVQGAGVKTENLQFDDSQAERVNDHLTITKLVGGKLVIDSDMSKLPFTEDFLNAAFPHGIDSAPQHQEIDIADAVRDNGEPIRIATVKVGSDWYPSLFYTLADYALQSDHKKWPTTPIAANGAGSPGDAVKQLAEAAIDGNLERVIELLPPDEMGALHDIGPVLIDEIGDVGHVNATITSLQTDTTEVTGGTKVMLKSLELTVDDVDYKFQRNGDCIDAERDGDQQHLCASDLASEIGKGDMPAAAEQALEHLATGMLKNTGVVTTKVDGKWYVSPLRSVTGLGIDALRSLQPNDIINLIKSIH